jgi:hypothetical protein
MSSDVIRSVVQTDYNNPRQLPTGGEWGIAIVWPDKATTGDRWGMRLHPSWAMWLFHH